MRGRPPEKPRGAGRLRCQEGRVIRKGAAGHLEEGGATEEEGAAGHLEEEGAAGHLGGAGGRGPFRGGRSGGSFEERKGVEYPGARTECGWFCLFLFFSISNCFLNCHFFIFFIYFRLKSELKNFWQFLVSLGV